MHARFRDADTPGILIRTRSGDDSSLTADDISTLAQSLRGELLLPATPKYEEARRIWNGMIEHRPSLIARCRSSADVVQAVRYAAEHDLLVAVRGGGHNIAGNALVDQGFVIDLSQMRSVRVDPGNRVAWVEPGARLCDVDHDTQEFGLATPLGINSTTGVAGLTLGGGYGWLSRLHGLTVDNLLAADIVTADGELLTVSERDHPDLFWAIRGGGGNFGVVTSFTFELHPVGPQVMAGLVIYPFEQAADVLGRYREIVADAPDALTAWVVMRKAPPLPFLAPEVHGQNVVVIPVCHVGSMEDAEREVKPLRTMGRAHADTVRPVAYTTFQATFDPLLAAGARNYWKTNNFLRLSDRLTDTLVEQAAELPGPMCEIFLAQLGGAVSRRPDDATPYAGRDAQFVMNVHARWDDAVDDERFVSWARSVYGITAKYAAPNAYVNFLTADEGARVRDAYGENYERLVAVKTKYDPRNMFRVNQNVVPSAARGAPAVGPHRAIEVPFREVEVPPSMER